MAAARAGDGRFQDHPPSPIRRPSELGHSQIQFRTLSSELGQYRTQESTCFFVGRNRGREAYRRPNRADLGNDRSRVMSQNFAREGAIEDKLADNGVRESDLEIF